MSNICILNASNPKQLHLESDEYVDLRDRKSCFKDGKIVKHCRSWHSWAYSLETEFFIYNKQGWPGVFKYDNVIILVNRDIQEIIPLIKKLKGMNKKVALAYHEGVQDLLYDPMKLIPLQEAVHEAGVFINFLGQYGDFFKGLFPKAKVIQVNHTNPYDWEYPNIKSWDERTGDILIGTRTLNNHLSRNTLVSIATLSTWQRINKSRKVDWICEDKGDIQGYLDKLGFDNINLHRGPLEYNDWLDFISNYKYIVHMDTSQNLGQISLDALMVDAIAVGGSTWINFISRTDTSYPTNLFSLVVKDTHKLRLEHGKDFEINFRELKPDYIKKKLIEVFQ